jgi:hypothetical protein
MMFALIDCNNFYTSCERLFRPDLRHQPIVVLSNNDRCVIARSNESKAFGVAVGEPFFKIKGLCKQHKILAFSSNHTLYGDISHRVMMTIDLLIITKMAKRCLGRIFNNGFHYKKAGVFGGFNSQRPASIGYVSSSI